MHVDMNVCIHTCVLECGCIRQRRKERPGLAGSRVEESKQAEELEEEWHIHRYFGLSLETLDTEVEDFRETERLEPGEEDSLSTTRADVSSLEARRL